MAGMFEPRICNGDCEHCQVKAANDAFVFKTKGSPYSVEHLQERANQASNAIRAAAPRRGETPEEHHARLMREAKEEADRIIEAMRKEPADPETEYKRATELIQRHRLPIKQGEPTVGSLVGVPLGQSEKLKQEPKFKHWRDLPVNEESEVHKAIRERNEEVAATKFLVRNPSEFGIPLKTVSERAPQTAFEIECQLASLEAEAKERADQELKDKLRKALS